MLIFFLKLQLVSDLSQGKSNFNLYLKTRGCPILAQPWVRSDMDGFLKKYGTSGDKTIGLGLVIRSTIIHKPFSILKIHTKKLEVFLILI